MPLSLPFSILAGQPVQSKPVRDNFQAIVDKFSGSIVDADLSTLAQLNGSKLADGTVPGAKIVPAGISSVQMGTDSVLTANIKNSTGVGDGVTASKLAIQSVLFGKIKTQAVVVTVSAGAANFGSLGSVAWDLSNAAPATSVAVAPTIAGSATGFPFSLERTRATVTGFGQAEALVAKVLLNTATSKWYLLVTNPATLVIVPDGLVFTIRFFLLA